MDNLYLITLIALVVIIAQGMTNARAKRNALNAKDVKIGMMMDKNIVLSDQNADLGRSQRSTRRSFDEGTKAYKKLNTLYEERGRKIIDLERRLKLAQAPKGVADKQL